MGSFAYLYATVCFKRCFCCLYTWLYGKNAVLRSGIVGLPNGWDGVSYKDSRRKAGIFFRLYVGFHYFIGMSLIPP